MTDMISDDTSLHGAIVWLMNDAEAESGSVRQRVERLNRDAPLMRWRLAKTRRMSSAQR